MLSATVFLTLGALAAHFIDRRRERIYLVSAAVILTLLVGISRVYLGVHWPTDVLAGWCVGSAWAVLWWMIATQWERLSPRTSPVKDIGDDRVPDSLEPAIGEL